MGLAAGAAATTLARMGQQIAVVEKPSPNAGVRRFEANRNLTGMGHEVFASDPSKKDAKPWKPEASEDDSDDK